MGQKIVIIGAGLAGLTAAVALARKGLEAEVYEQAPELKEVGAGVGLWGNAFRALEAIGWPGTWNGWPADSPGRGARDALVRAMPLSVQLRQLDLVVGRPSATLPAMRGAG
jgi:2-polyprenyl-6-methoxyphenol hydroxylase-like FAD-dependent oxidoreductase